MNAQTRKMLERINARKSVPASSARPMKAPDHVVYVIHCSLTGQVYVGQTTDMVNRRAQHLHRLRNGCHHSGALQDSWNEHGESAFTFATLEGGVTSSARYEREQWWMDRYRGRLFNTQATALPDGNISNLRKDR